jgi:hypothetical protein
MPKAKRYFTLEQANAVVRAIRPLLAEILSIRQEILDRQPEFWPVVAKVLGNGGNKAASEVADQFQRLDGLVREVNATGAILKDVNTGLVDFPAKRGNQEIYLCWQYGEDEILYWHGIDAGFAGRQLIS